MRPKILLIALCSVFLLSCDGTPPEAPEVFICTYYHPEQVFLCSSNKTDAKKEIPADQAHKYVATSPDDWQKIQLYIRDLKKKIVDCKKP